MIDVMNLEHNSKFISYFQEMISNAILRDLMQRKSVTKSMFRDNHPGGSIGRILAQESKD